MMGFDEAWNLVAGRAKPLGRETVPLAAGHRRTLAEPVVAQVDWPPADVSAMDGYAVRDSEFTGGRTSFRLVGESFAGAPFEGVAEAGECVRIFTGGVLPEGFDRVIVQEVVSRDGDIALVEGPVSDASHVRLRGQDFRTGDTLLEPGRLLDARALVAAAGADVADLVVWRRPRIASLSTGDELVEPGRSREVPHSIPESLAPGLAALVEDWGGETVAASRLRDEPALIQARAAEAVGSSDLVIVTGGASVGEKDFAKSAFAALGLELIFSKVAIKPGKPVWFGRIGDTLVMGLPGNPTSAMVTARLLLAPLVAGLAGRDPAAAARWRSAGLDGELGPVSDRETFVRARRAGERAAPLGNQDSGAQRALADADLLIRRRIGAEPVAVGEAVEVLDF
jgi:molybdopterin molybdotransferase